MDILKTRVGEVSLCKAAEKGDIAQIEGIIHNHDKLVEDFDVNRSEKWNRTPLHWACSTGQHNVVEALLGLGAKLLWVDDLGWTPLHWAVNNDHLHVAASLLQFADRYNYRRQLFQLKDKEGLLLTQLPKSENMRKLIGAKKLRPDKIHRNVGIHQAAERGELSTLQYLIDVEGVPVNKQGYLARTALHWAASTGHTEVVAYLLTKGTDTDIQDADGFTPLHWASNNGHVGVVRQLLNGRCNRYVMDIFAKYPLDVAKSEATRKALADPRNENFFANYVGETGSTKVEFDVIVVGAGIAGLSAARELLLQSNRKLSVTVLEARDRFGGRIYSYPMKDVNSHTTVVDVGAGWLHGIYNNPMAEFAKTFGVECQLSKGTYCLFDRDGKPHQQMHIDIANTKMRRILKQIRKRRKTDKQECSLQQAIDDVIEEYPELGPTSDLESRLMTWLWSGLEQYESGMCKEMSYLQFETDMELPGGDYYPIGGYFEILKGIARGIDIKYECIVERIDYTTHGTTVYTNKGVYRAKYVICTLPLGVLKQDTVKFNPPLPIRKQQAISNVGFGLMNKVVLKFAEPFWNSEMGWMGFSSDTRARFRWFFNMIPSTGENILTAFLTCDFGKDLESESDQVIVEQTLDVLRNIFAKTIPQPIATAVTRWGQDPFAGGSYSFKAVGCNPDDYAALAASVDNTLFFAGEATHANFPATVHGACVSGLREARRLIQTMKESKLRSCVQSRL